MVKRKLVEANGSEPAPARRSTRQKSSLQSEPVGPGIVKKSVTVKTTKPKAIKTAFKKEEEEEEEEKPLEKVCIANPKLHCSVEIFRRARNCEH
jgi:hypothetical protein